MHHKPAAEALGMMPDIMKGSGPDFLHSSVVFQGSRSRDYHSDKVEEMHDPGQNRI